MIARNISKLEHRTLIWHCARHQAKRLVSTWILVAVFTTVSLVRFAYDNSYMSITVMATSIAIAWGLPVIWLLVVVPSEARRHLVNRGLEVMAYGYSGAGHAEAWLAQFRHWLNADLFCCQYGASTEETILALDGCADGFRGHLVAHLYPGQNNGWVDVHRLARDFTRACT